MRAENTDIMLTMEKTQSSYRLQELLYLNYFCIQKNYIYVPASQLSTTFNIKVKRGQNLVSRFKQYPTTTAELLIM